MKVKLKRADVLIHEHHANVNLGKKGAASPGWLKILEAIGGLTLEVETEHLFGDQYNTKVPEHLKGDLENGVRVMDDMIVEVIDDVRPDAGQCDYCGLTVLNAKPDGLIGKECPKCRPKSEAAAARIESGDEGAFDRIALHVGTIQPVIGERVPSLHKIQSHDERPVGDTRKAMLRKVEREIEEKTRDLREKERMLSLLPDSLRYLHVFARKDNGWGSVYVKLPPAKTKADILAYVAALTPCPLSRVHEKGWAASFYPSANIPAKKREKADIVEAAPIILRSDLVPGSHVSQEMEFYCEIQGTFVSVHFEFKIPGVLTHHTYGERWDQGQLVAAQTTFEHKFAAARVDRIGGGTPGVPNMRLWWPANMTVAEILDGIKA
jgi:hypothetical protein